MKSFISATRIIVAMLLVFTMTTVAPVATVGATPKNSNAAAAPSHAKKDKNDNNGNNGKHQGQKPESGKHEEPRVTEPTSNQTSTNDSAERSTAESSEPKTLSARSTDPSGNNGFIKVNEEEAPDSIPNNDPHVTCQFNVEFYNYDKNANYYADVIFSLHSPTNSASHILSVTEGNLQPFIGEDQASGGNDLDAFETYRLAFSGSPHPQQGYHVKLTIHADGSRGSDVKHKVFWVTPCQASTPSTPTTPVQPSIVGGRGGSEKQSDVQSATTERTLSTNALPETLPQTGLSPLLSLLLALSASTIAYALSLWYQKRSITTSR